MGDCPPFKLPFLLLSLLLREAEREIGGLSVRPGLIMDLEETLMAEDLEGREEKQMKRSLLVVEGGAGGRCDCGLSNSILFLECV